MISGHVTPSIDIVKQAVSSCATCTPGTPEALILLLNPPVSTPSAVSQVQNGKKPKGLPGTAPKSSRGTIVAKNRARATNIQDQASSALKPLERLKLATEVINLSLKALTEAVKINPTKRISNAPQTIERGSLISKASSLQANPTSPLQPRSINRPSSSPKKSPKQSTKCSIENENMIALAECARAALAALRKTTTSQNNNDRLPLLQIETGMSALIAKLLSLEMLDLASREIYILCRRLGMGRDSPSLVRDKPELNNKRIESAVNLSKATLVDLLHVSQIPNDAVRLSLITATQLQIFRLLSLKPRPFDGVRLADALSLDFVSSPVYLIESSAALQGQERSARQLSSLAQNILDLSRAHQCHNGADRVLGCCSSGCVFRLQILSLQISWKSWLLLGHRVDLVKQVIVPLKKYLGTFLQGSSISLEDVYALAESKLDAIYTMISTSGLLDSSNQQELNLLRLYFYQSLLDIVKERAISSKCSAMISSWAQQSLQLAEQVNVSNAKRCSIQCRVAVSYFRHSSIEQEECKIASLRRVIELLNSSLDGGSEDLDDLLANVSSLRKSAMAAIAKQSQIISKNCKLQNRLLPLLIQFVPRSLGFLIRYLGKDPGVKGGNSRLRFDKRLELMSKVAPATIGNVTTLANMVVNHNIELWKPIDEALQNCVDLAKDVGLYQLSEGSQHSKKPAASIHVLISNIYWNRYLALKRQNCDPRTVKQALEKAISFLSNQSTGNQSEGQILAKLERLGSLYENLGEWDTVAKLCSQALEFLQSNGDIDEAARTAREKSMNAILIDNGPFKAMVRILESYCRAFMRINEASLEVYSVQKERPPSPIAQGFLLEAQLFLFVRMMRQQKDMPKAAPVIKNISEKLLVIYTVEDFPLRRLRTLSMLLECSLWDESLRSCALFCEPMPEIFRSLGHDAGLAQYEWHYRGHFGALVALIGDSLDMELLQSSLDIWKGYLTGENSVSWESFEKRIGDVEGLLALLDTVEEYLYPLSCTSASITVLRLTVSVLRTAKSMDHTRFIRKTSALALQLIELGFTDEASAVLQEGRSIVESETVEDQSCFQWHQAYANYYVVIGTPYQSLEHIQAAKRALSTTLGSEVADLGRSPRGLLLLAHLLQVSSKAAFAMEHRQKALCYARRASSVVSRAWSLLERMQKSPNPSIFEPNSQGLSVNRSEIGLLKTPAPEIPTNSSLLPSAIFWPYVRPMVDGLLMLCSLLVNDGLFLESQHYVEQADKIASIVKGSRLDLEVKVSRADFLVRSGQTKQGLELLKDMDGFLQTERDTDDPQIVLLQAKIAAARASTSSAFNEDSLNESYKALSKVNLSSSNWLVEPDGSTDTLVVELGNLSLTGGTAQKAEKRKATRGGIEKAKEVTKAQSLPRRPKDSVNHSIPVQELLDQLLQSILSTLIRKGKVEDASSALEQASALANNGRGSLVQSISKIHLLLNQTMSLLESHPVFNILSESTLASPVVNVLQSAQKHLSSTTAPHQRQAKKRSKTVATTKTRAREDSPSDTGYHLYLKSALEIVASLPNIAQSARSTAILHNWSDMISKLFALASTVCNYHDLPCASSMTLAHALELGRLAATTREQLHIRVEKQLSRNNNPWTLDFGDDIDNPIAPKIDLSDFQPDFIDVIPDSWTAISLSVNDSYDEFRICRLKANSTPFVICIPLGKKGMRESGDDSFGYEEAKAELRKIIDLANFSAHDAGNLSQKGAKTAWWEARAELDSRLKDLLINIENIWFGGFRGAMKHSNIRADFMARFQQTFVRTLDKHLPSRSARASKEGRVALDSKVLELFVALGNPRNFQDIDEPILDLLYFVVDILQFNGERNAYDEIDFDPMVIEVQDALSHYHELAKADNEEDQDGHTILILDKKLHQFPWESLPCLAGQSISRLPSLVSLRDRILNLERVEGISRSSLSINRTNGAYVLNPSGDLKHTQASLETPLSTLDGWSTTTNQAPKESELATTLATKSLYLYFGHGSGGQFIRSRTIRRLDQCAVSLLMGCSSSSLTEAGEFEPYGTPINYLQAGAPAVVGTLWDVTDKDIDRFSLKLLERWGLFGSHEDKSGNAKIKRSASPAKKGPKGKGRQRSRTRERERQDEVQISAERSVTLDRAVAEARDSCILRYLNGAAPVVYGIPVSLS